MEEKDITDQVRQAEDAIIQLAREKKKAYDISANAERLVAVAENQIDILKSSSKSLESLSESITTTAEVSKTTITSIYRDASKSLNETTLRMEAIRDEFRKTDMRMQSLDESMQARSIDLQNQIKNLLNQIVEVNKSIQASQKSIINNKKWIILSLLAAAGALVIAAVGLL